MAIRSWFASQHWLVFGNDCSVPGTVAAWSDSIIIICSILSFRIPFSSWVVLTMATLPRLSNLTLKLTTGLLCHKRWGLPETRWRLFWSLQTMSTVLNCVLCNFRQPCPDFYLSPTQLRHEEKQQLLTFRFNWVMFKGAKLCPFFSLQFSADLPLNVRWFKFWFNNCHNWDFLARFDGHW